MNISTYESKINALESGGGGGGGSSDGLFVITIDMDNMTSDKTFSEVKNAVLNNTPILINIGGPYLLPDMVGYDDYENNIQIQLTMLNIQSAQTPLGSIFFISLKLNSNEELTVVFQKGYTFEITEVNG